MTDTTESLLKLRRLTRALAESLQAQMTEYLSTLTPLLRPKTVLGDYVQGPGMKEAPKRADKAFQELQALWAAFSATQVLGIDRTLTPPLDVSGMGLEFAPVDYAYEAARGPETKALTVRSPLRWYLSYSGFGRARLSELMAHKGRNSEELQRFVLHCLVLHVVVAQQPGLVKILDALHFPLTTEREEKFGGLPMTMISCAVTTRRPSDDVIVQSAELTGMNAFEEVVVVSDIERLSDPLQTRMLEAVRAIDKDLLASP